MDKKTKEMIELGAGCAVNCGFCLEYHKKKPIEAGLTEAEMLAAIAERCKDLGRIKDQTKRRQSVR